VKASEHGTDIKVKGGKAGRVPEMLPARASGI